MRQFYKKITLFIISVTFFSIQAHASGIGYDSNPSSISASLTMYNTSTPTLITSKEPYGGKVCALSSGTSSSSGYKTASAKWRQPNIAGTISLDGYTYEIQRTNILGIGIIARTSAVGGEGEAAITPANTTVGSSYQTIMNLSDPKDTVYLGNKYWALVTIPGDTMVPGTYSLDSSTTMVDVWCQAETSDNNTNGGGYLSGSVQILAPTCSLSSDTASTINIDLGSHQWSDVKNLSVGSNFGSATKTINLTCPEGALPKLTVYDLNDNSNNTQNISLTSPSSSGTASGVAVQLFLDNQSTAYPMSSSVNLVSDRLTKNTTVALLLEFKYIKVSTSVSPGSANAIVNLVFEYN